MHIYIYIYIYIYLYRLKERGRRVGGILSFFRTKKRGRQGKGWPPPTQLSWFIRKKKSRRYVSLFLKKQIGGRQGKGWPPPTHLSWFIAKKKSRRGASFFFCQKKNNNSNKIGRWQAGQGMATTHPALMVHKKKVKGR